MTAHYDFVYVAEHVSDQAEQAMFEANLPVNVAWYDGLTLVEATVRVTNDPVKGAIGFAKILESHGVKVLRLDLDLVNQNQIATRCEVSRSAVSQWVNETNAGRPFPKPHTIISGPVWAWSDINEWLRRSGKPRFDDSTPASPAHVDEFNRDWGRLPMQTPAGKEQPWSSVTVQQSRVSDTGWVRQSMPDEEKQPA